MPTTDEALPRTRSLVLVGLVAFSCGLGSALVFSVARPLVAEEPPASVPAVCDEAPRRPDVWLAGDVTREWVQEQHAQVVLAHKFVRDNYAEFNHFDGWIEGFADDSPVGIEIASCRRTIEPWLTSQCLWDHELVLQRTSGTEGRVAAIITYPPRCPSSACQALYECLSRAWERRRVSLPVGGPRDHIVLRTGVHSYNPSYLSSFPWYALGVEAPAGAIPNLVYITSLEKALERTEREIAEYKAKPEPESIYWQHGLRFHMNLAGDIRAVLSVKTSRSE